MHDPTEEAQIFFEQLQQNQTIIAALKHIFLTSWRMCGVSTDVVKKLLDGYNTQQNGYRFNTAVANTQRLISPMETALLQRPYRLRLLAGIEEFKRMKGAIAYEQQVLMEILSTQWESHAAMQQNMFMVQSRLHWIRQFWLLLQEIQHPLIPWYEGNTLRMHNTFSFDLYVQGPVMHVLQDDIFHGAYDKHAKEFVTDELLVRDINLSIDVDPSVAVTSVDEEPFDALVEALQENDR